MRKKSRIIMLVICFVMIGMNYVALSQNEPGIEYGFQSKILKPIVRLEKDEMLKQQINEKSFPIEYYFCINNYNENEINEVEFDYTIEIENSEEGFPVSYQLIDCATNQEIELLDGKSESLRIQKSVKESRKFKLVLQWQELEGELAEKLQIKLKINVIQSKE